MGSCPDTDIDPINLYTESSILTVTLPHFILIYLVIYLKQLQFFGLDQGAIAINCVCMSLYFDRK